ncbi:glycosyltransferase [Ideonella sp. DXS22W]|uniref:Glycosyltransferase n=1 Tax=Pseudaquabacterium inlustre TaxID=2984192 RepID=A0ABU9CE20_9BURK
MQQPAVRILYFIPEPVDTFRVDVSTLFGPRLAELGVQTHVVGMPPGAPMDASRYAAVSYPQDSGSRLVRELRYVALVLALLARSRGRYDLIQVRDMVPTGVLAFVFSVLLRLPFVYWMSYLMSEGRIAQARKDGAAAKTLRARLRAKAVLTKGVVERRLLYGWLLPRARHVFVQSEAMGRWVDDQTNGGVSHSAVPMGVDTTVLNPQAVVPRRLDEWRQDFVIGYLGTLSLVRGFDQLIDALVLVQLSIPGARLLLIGDGPSPRDAQEILSYAARRGVADSVRITGWLAREEAMPLLAGVNIAVSNFPRSELLDTCSPTKVVEYLALAIPCVGNDNPDQAALLRSSGAGRLCESTAQALAAGIVDLASDLHGAWVAAARGPGFVRAHRDYRVLAAQVRARYAQAMQSQSGEHA